MASIYDLIVKLPAVCYKAVVDFSDFLKSPRLCLENRQQIRGFFKDSDLELDNKKVWEKAFLYYAISSPRAARKIADNFLHCHLECKKQTDFIEDDSPIYICVVKDDLERIKMSYEHHKEIGVNKFIFIDNGSSDGTYEWLLSQPVTVYQTNDKFIMWAKIGWISRVINQYGFNRWYLILDSDELFVYPHCEDKEINEYIANLKKNGLKCVFSFMLDMYAKNGIFEPLSQERGIKEQFCYFDANSYKKTNCLHYQKIVGGPRERFFGTQDGIEMVQNKYPLVYYKKGDVYRFHYMSPYKQNFSSKCTCALLHYKFIGGDYEKYKKIAADGNYANGSKLYKDILKKIDENSESISFYNENSIKYSSSIDLVKHELIDDWM